MTKQEKRDYLILEMAQQLCECAGISCQDCPKAHSPEEYGECELPEICNTLADYVIRKEEEAKKERTKEIFTKLIGACKFDGHTVNLYQSEIMEFAKDFGAKM